MSNFKDFWETESNLIRKADYPVKVMFLTPLSEAVKKVVHFKNSIPYECAGKRCPLCADGYPQSKSFYIEVYDIETGAHRILSGSKKLGLALADWEDEIIEEEEKEDGLTGKAFKISRLGEERNPDWQLKPLTFNKKVKPKIDVEEEVRRILRSASDFEEEEKEDEELAEEFDV